MNMDRTGLYEVTRATYVEARDEGHTLMVRIPIDHEGKREHMIVDRQPREVFVTRREAVLSAVARLRELARKNSERADELLATLIK